MRDGRTCIRIRGTRTEKIRALVEAECDHPRFEVTIGGNKWGTLDDELKRRILDRAHLYIKHLKSQLGLAEIEYHSIDDEEEVS